MRTKIISIVLSVVGISVCLDCYEIYKNSALLNNYDQYFEEENKALKKKNDRLNSLLRNQLILKHPKYQPDYKHLVLPQNIPYSDSLARRYFGNSHEGYVNEMIKNNFNSLVDQLNSNELKLLTNEIKLNKLINFGLHGFTNQGMYLSNFSIFRTYQDSVVFGIAANDPNMNTKRVFLSINDNVIHPLEMVISKSIPNTDTVRIKTYTIMLKSHNNRLDTLLSNTLFIPSCSYSLLGTID